MTTAVRSNQIVDELNRPVQGASVYVYALDGSLASLTSDGTTSIPNPLTTDAFGNYSYYALVGYYREDVWFNGAKRWSENNVAVGSPGSDLALRSDLAASTGAALVGDFGGGTVQDAIFTKGLATAVAGVKAAVRWVRNNATFPLENVGSLWTGKSIVDHGIAARFALGDTDAGNPGFALLVTAENDGTAGEVVALGGKATVHANNGTVIAGNIVATTIAAIDGAKIIGLELDIEADPTATNLSTGGRGLDVVALNLAYPFPAIHVGGISGGTFANGIELGGLATTAAGLALASGGTADSLTNSSVGTFTTAAHIMAAGKTNGIKWDGTGGWEYYNGDNQRYVLPTCGSLLFRDATDATTLVSIESNAGAGVVNAQAAGGEFHVNGTKVVGARQTGWAADTGTAEKTAHATYTAGTTLTFSATYTQSELTALATRLASVETALQAVTRGQKAIKDLLIAHGLGGA